MATTSFLNQSGEGSVNVTAKNRGNKLEDHITVETDKRLNHTLEQEIANPKSRVYQPTFKGFLSEQMNSEKKSVDQQPSVVNSVTRIPGQIGWGIERKHLWKDNVLLTDDLSTNFPVVKDHVTYFDKNKTANF